MRFTRWLTVCLLFAVSYCTDLRAGLIINLSEVGSDVVVTGSGTVNTAALTGPANGSNGATFNPTNGIMLLGGTPATSALTSRYGGLTGPTTFGTGSAVLPNTGTGDRFGVIGLINTLILPRGYVSGTALSATNTFNSSTFTSLGFTPGTYTWTWGAGANADSLVVNIGVASPAAVPEPSTFAALSVGVACIGWCRRRKRRVSVQ